jgi:hypothetical protein
LGQRVDAQVFLDALDPRLRVAVKPQHGGPAGGDSRAGRRIGYVGRRHEPARSPEISSAAAPVFVRYHGSRPPRPPETPPMEPDPAAGPPARPSFVVGNRRVGVRGRGRRTPALGMSPGAGPGPGGGMSEEAYHVAAELPPPWVVSSFRSVWRIRRPPSGAPPGWAVPRLSRKTPVGRYPPPTPGGPRP